jgi:hypothetical protein
MPGAGRTRAPCVQRKVHFAHARQQQGSQNNRHSLRDGFNGCFVLSLECRLVSLHRLAKRPARLDPSNGGSGPHDLTVREDAFVRATSALSLLASTASPLPTSVTIAIRPSSGGGMHGYNHDFTKNGRGIFFAGGLDGFSEMRTLCPTARVRPRGSPRYIAPCPCRKNHRHQQIRLFSRAKRVA